MFFRTYSIWLVFSSVGSNPFCGSGIWDFWRVCSSVLVDELGFGRVQSLVCPDMRLGSAIFWLNMFKVWAFWRVLVPVGLKFSFGG